MTLICYTFGVLFVNIANFTKQNQKKLNLFIFYSLRFFSIFFDFIILLPVTGVIFTNFNSIPIFGEVDLIIDIFFAFNIFTNFFKAQNFFNISFIFCE